MPFTRPKASQIDFDVTNITDPLIRLNSGESGSADKDVGIVIERGSDTNAALLYDESANEFVVVNTTEDGTTSGNVTISSYAPLQVSTFKSSGATMTGAIAMGTNKITGLGDPSANQDAATKAYVDSTVSGFGSLSNVVEDTTPQLGGNLDVNTKNINFGDSASSSDDRLNFGAGTDLSIYHDGTDNTIITNSDLNFNATGEIVVSGDAQYETRDFVVSGSRTGTGGAISRVIWRNRGGSTDINANSAETRIEGWRINGDTPSLIFNFGGTERHRFDDDGKIALGAVPGSIGSITETVEITGTLSTTSTAKLASIELGGTTDTTLARSSAGVVTIEGVEVTTNTATQTLTNKTINSNANTLHIDLDDLGTFTGTLAEFNSGLQGDSFVSLTGSETLTNKTLTNPTINAFSGTGNGSITGDLTLSGTLNLSATSGTAITTTGNLASADLGVLRASAGTGGSDTHGFTIKYMGTRTGNNNSYALIMDNQTGTDVEAMTVLQDGKVGINNTSPGQALDVTGSIAVGTAIELGHASDTTLARSSAGVVTIEGVEVTTNTASQTLTNKTLTSPTINAFSGTGNGSITGTLSIDNTTTGDSLLITTTEASSTAAPVITMKRNSGSPADADYLGQLKFKGENDADQEVVYAKITGKIQDASDGSEDGIIEFANVKAGSNTITARLRSDSLQLLNSTGLTVAGNTTLTGNLALNAQADLQFYDSDSSHYVGFQAPATISSSILWTLPNTDGTDGQIIKTDGAGTLSWTDNSGGGGSGSSFPNSTFTTCPASDGNDFDLSFNVAQTSQETPFEASGTDAFGVNLGSVFSLMDPVGQTDGPFDMGALT